jgi:hypothetical protein
MFLLAFIIDNLGNERRREGDSDYEPCPTKLEAKEMLWFFSRRSTSMLLLIMEEPLTILAIYLEAMKAYLGETR